jgi:O-antigen/teichoic acid export membrane protein
VGRGVIVNAAFDVSLSLLSLIQGLLLAAILTRADYGIWGILVVSLGVLAQLKLVGISDKYLQQDESDQERAFQKAFTFELMMTFAATVPLLVALPVIAVVYNHWSLVPPGLVLITVLIADGLQAPIWVQYRQMNFVRQRTLTAVEPIVGFVATVILAILGFGYWALALGVVIGAWTGAAVAIRSCPFPFKWRYDSGALRVYAAFSVPIFIATAATVLMANGSMVAVNAHLGLAGAGAVALAAKLTEFTTRVDTLVSGTLYPAICAIQGRLELLRETFVKSNRLALMWAAPFGIGVTLFAADLVRFGVGQKWHPAIPLVEIMGLTAAVNQAGFNWDDYFRARSETRPIAVTAVAAAAVTLGAGIPLVFVDGLTGLGIGIAAGVVVQLGCRAWYLSQLFEGFGFASHAARALIPAIVGGGAVLAVRGLESGSRVISYALGELVLYALVTGCVTWWLEGRLIGEAVGYLRPQAG